MADVTARLVWVNNVIKNNEDLPIWSKAVWTATPPTSLANTELPSIRAYLQLGLTYLVPVSSPGGSSDHRSILSACLSLFFNLLPWAILFQKSYIWIELDNNLLVRSTLSSSRRVRGRDHTNVTDFNYHWACQLLSEFVCNMDLHLFD